MRSIVLSVAVTACAAVLTGVSAPAARAADASGGQPTAEDSGPVIYQLDNQNLKPSIMQRNGGFPVVVLGRSYQRVCSFHLWREDLDFHDWTRTDLGTHKGADLRYVDYVEGDWSAQLIRYRMQAFDCQGHAGPEVSKGFYPFLRDQDDGLDFNGAAGSTVTSPDAIGGSYKQVKGPSRALGLSLRNSEGTQYYNQALYARTGPDGGEATVYVDGVRRGSASFYSPRVRQRVLVFSYGTTDYQEYGNLRLVMTGAGPGGGTTMTVDALNTFETN